MSYKGSSWKNHKYIKKMAGRYYYNPIQDVEEAKEIFDEEVENIKDIFDDEVKNDKKSAINLPSFDIEITPETIKRGKETIFKTYERFKDLDIILADNLQKGVDYFNKILHKIF